MQRIGASPTIKKLQPEKPFIALTIIILFILAAMFAWRMFNVLPASPALQLTTISQSVLEEKYGLRVNLIAVTGAGGFIDLRLKIVDGDKMKLLLTDKKNFPALVSINGKTLTAPEDTINQKIDFTSGGSLFIMYPNSGNAIKRDEPVSVLFGNIALESITSK